MLRSPLYLGTLFLTLLTGAVGADPPALDHGRKLDTLAVQQAMATARQHLRESHAKQAVELLEDQLARSGGHQGYLDLLRDAYRDYVMRLSLERETTLAERYLQRLKILDPQAALELTVDKDKAVKFEARPTPKAPPTPLPNFAAKPTPGPNRAPIVTASTGAKPTAVRGQMEDPADDPFNVANQRLPSSLDGPQLATQFVARANEEFTLKRYKEARLYYEQAFLVDQRCTETCRESWAYCMLNDVVEALNRPGLGGKGAPELQKDVHGALAMAPKLAATGEWLLREIDQRSKAVAAPSPAQEVPIAMQHFGRNQQGWQVTETSHFLIYHNQPRELVERVAQGAERTRLQMSRKWFANDGAPWQPKCELVLHATAAEYSRQTGVPTTSPGHSRIESDPSSHRVVGRRMDLHLDHVGTVEAVLPHETTHVVLAGQFGHYQVPRWADEGMAVLSEPAEKVEQHRRNLAKAARDGQLFGVRELLELDNYPQAQKISTFYAQSVGLVDFLAQQRGPVVFAEFVRDGLRTGWDAAARKHYTWDLGQLQQRWDTHVQGDMQRLAASSR